MPRVSQQHRDRRRQQILDAAQRCFGRRGFHGTSMQDLFSESQLSSGAVYLHFKSKDAIVLAIAEHNMAAVLEVLHTAAESEAPRGSSLGDVLLTAVSALTSGGERGGVDDAAPMAVQVWAEALTNPAVADGMTALVGRLTRQVEELLGAGRPAVDSALTYQPAPSTRSQAVVIVAVLAGLIWQRSLLGPAALDEAAAGLRHLFPWAVGSGALESDHSI